MVVSLCSRYFFFAGFAAGSGSGLAVVFFSAWISLADLPPPRFLIFTSARLPDEAGALAGVAAAAAGWGAVALLAQWMH